MVGATRRIVGSRAGIRFPARSVPTYRRVGLTLLSLGVAVAVLWLTGDPGAAQADAVNVSNTAGPSSAPAIARSPDGTAMIVWEEGSDLWFARRSSGAWSTAAPVPSATGMDPALATTPDGGFDLVWSDFSALDGNFEVYFSHWANGQWSLPVNVSASPDQSMEPDIGVQSDGGRLVVWSEVDDTGEPLVYGASSGDGQSWASAPVPDAAGEVPRVAAGTGSSRWHLAWLGSPDGVAPATVLYMARRTAGGWSLPEIMDPTTAGAAVDAPDLSVGPAGQPRIAWRENDSGITLARLDGDTWQRTSIAQASPDVGAPAVAIASDGAALVAYADGIALRLCIVTAGGDASTTTLATFAGGAFEAAISGSASGAEPADAAVEGRLTGVGDIYVVAGAGVSATATPTPPSTTAPTATPGPTSVETVTATASSSASPTATSMSTPTATASMDEHTWLYLPFASAARR